MQINGIEFDFDFADADDLERFETAYTALSKETEAKAGESNAQTLRRQCAATKTFFDEVLGQGSYDKIIDKPQNIRSNTEAIYDFADAYAAALEEMDALAQKRKARYEKYIPGKRRGRK